MCEQLPARTNPTELLRNGNGPPARRNSGELQKGDEQGQAGVPSRIEQQAFNGTGNTVQGIHAHEVSVTIKQEVNNYYAPVTIRQEVRNIEQTKVEIRPTHIENRPVLIDATSYRPSYTAAPARKPPVDEGSALAHLFKVFLGFIAIIFIVVAGFRAISTPSTVIVEEAPKPMTFMDYLEAQSRESGDADVPGRQ